MNAVLRPSQRESGLRTLAALFLSNGGVNVVYFACLGLLGLFLTNADFGHFRVAYALIAMAASIAVLGMNSSFVKHFSAATLPQRRAALAAALSALTAASFAAGVLAWLQMPIDRQWRDLADVLYFGAFPVAVLGATISHLGLSVLQAEGRLGDYARLQFAWRAILFGSACAAGLSFGARAALWALALSYLVTLPIVLRRIRDSLPRRGAARDWSHWPVIARSSVWPFAAVCVSTLYGNVEFLFFSQADIESGYAGSYALAALIYQGGSAIFFPLQTYAADLVVNRGARARDILRLQAGCFAGVLALAVLALEMAQVMHHYAPAKFDAAFLDLSNLIAFKLVVWGGYAVTGSVIYFVGKEFQSFLLSVFALLVLLLAPVVTGMEQSVRNLVLFQIATSVALLAGSTWLFLDGHRKHIASQQGNNA